MVDMHRRKFLTLLGFAGMTTLNLFPLQFSLVTEMKELLKSVFYFFKPTFDPPGEGDNIPVETALNSRCTSDYDGNPEKFHWGMFDRKKKLSTEQVKRTISLAKIPRFTDQKVQIRSERNILTFIVENHASDIMRDWMMVESGMQQQAVGLVCATLGVGMVFRNIGKDGKSISDTNYGTINIKLGPMKPAYGGSFWSNLPPAARNPWLVENLPDPVRDGSKSLISTLRNLKIKNKGHVAATEQSMSQLLWAARGRTPHLYNRKPWGMTIPTWAGKQNISSVYVVSNNRLSKYINWNSKHNRPTHALAELNKIDTQLFHNLVTSFSANHGFIILGKNEDFARALWEVGYQLLNLLLQADSLDIPYEAVLLNEAQKSTVSLTGVNDPVAILAI